MAILVNVYMRNVHYRDRLEMLEELIEQIRIKYDKQLILIGGDFNGRIGLSNQMDNEQAEGTKFTHNRQSKDHSVNTNGKELLIVMESAGMHALNGR